uniref:Chitin-binding type-2 domain-containing protein n=1 Tax=Parascaris univalens TaxID=6257 RepID=A0A915CIB3_PARUN
MKPILQLWTGFVFRLGLLFLTTISALSLKRYPENFYVSEAVELCVDKSDGVYSLGCIAEFVDCSQGQSFVMRCADGSVMDGDQGECVPRAASSICLKDGRSLSVEFVMKNIPNTNKDVYRSHPVRSDFCAKRINGNYNIGCTSGFLTCVAGEPVAMECPKGMVYDEALSRCERSEYVRVCENIDIVPSNEGRPSKDVFRVQRRVAMRSVSDSLIFPTTLPTRANIEATPSDHELCRGRPSGLYAKGCSGQVLWCTDGVVTVLSCPFGFLYEQNSRRCVPRGSLAECPPELQPVIFAPSSTAWWTFPSSEPGTVSEGRRTDPLDERSSADPKELPSPDNISIACTSLRDGVHPEGCSKFFVVCIGQKAVVKECPSTLVYDIISGLCLLKDSVSSCAESSVVGSRQKVTTSGEADTNISEESEIFCKDHGDGIYGEDCSSRFFVCLSHEALRFNCPNSYVFDSSVSHCTNIISVSACTKTDFRNETSMSESSLADMSQLTKEVPFEFLEDVEPDEDLPVAVSSLGATAQEVMVLKTSDESFGSACTGMPDGAISLGCSTDFIICAAEEARLHRCPFELKYDSQSEMCIHEIEVTACIEGAADLSLVSGRRRAYASANVKQRSIDTATGGSRVGDVLSDRVKDSLAILGPTNMTMISGSTPSLSSQSQSAMSPIILSSVGTRMGDIGDTGGRRYTVQDASILLQKSVKHETAKEEIAALAHDGAQPDTQNTVIEETSGEIPITASTSPFETQTVSFAGGEMNTLVPSGSSAKSHSRLPRTFTTEAIVLSPSSYQAPTLPTVLEHLTEYGVPSPARLKEQSTAALSMASSEWSIPAGVGKVENSEESVTENVMSQKVQAVEGQSEMGTSAVLSKKNTAAELTTEEEINGKAMERADIKFSVEKDAISALSDSSEAMVYIDEVVNKLEKESVEATPVTEVAIDGLTADEAEVPASASGEVALPSGDEAFSIGGTTIASAATLVEPLFSLASSPSDTIPAALADEAATLSKGAGASEIPLQAVFAATARTGQVAKEATVHSDEQFLPFGSIPTRTVADVSNAPGGQDVSSVKDTTLQSLGDRTSSHLLDGIMLGLPKIPSTEHAAVTPPANSMQADATPLSLRRDSLGDTVGATLDGQGIAGLAVLPLGRRIANPSTDDDTSEWRAVAAATLGEVEASTTIAANPVQSESMTVVRDWSVGYSLAPEVVSSSQAKMVPVADNSVSPAAGLSTEYVASRVADRALLADEYAKTTLMQISAFPSLALLIPGKDNAVSSAPKEEGDLSVNTVKMAVENGTVTPVVENSAKLLPREDCCVSSAVERVASDRPNITVTSRYEANRQAGMERISYPGSVDGSAGLLSGKMAILPGTVAETESLLAAEAGTDVTANSLGKLKEAGHPEVSPLDTALSKEPSEDRKSSGGQRLDEGEGHSGFLNYRLTDTASAIGALVDGITESSPLDELVDLEAVYELKHVKLERPVQEGASASTQPSDVSSGNFQPVGIRIEAMGKPEVNGSSVETRAEGRGPQAMHSTNAWQRKTDAFSAKASSADERGVEAERSIGTEFGTETSGSILMSTASTETSHSENVDGEGRYSIAAFYDGGDVQIVGDSTKGSYQREYHLGAENFIDSKSEVRKASDVTAFAVSGLAHHQPTASAKAVVVPLPTNIRREFSCMGIPDGPKAIGCSSDYVVCLFGKTYWLKCENDLKFDEDTLQCMAAANIAACAKQRHDGTISTTPIAKATFMGEVAERKNEVSGILSSASREVASTKKTTAAVGADELVKSAIPQPPIANHKDSACSDLPDGIYGVGCSPLILFCILGENRYVECPRNQVFDPVSQKCLLPWFVRACRQSPHAAVENWSTGVFVESASVVKSVDDDARKSSRVRTTAEVTTEPSILPHEVPAKSFETDRVATVPATIAVELTQKPLNGSTLGSSSSSTLMSSTSSAIKSLTKFSCHGREGTFFVVGCSSVYVSCMVEPYGLRFCRDSFAFDQQSNECRKKSAVSACQKTTLDVKGKDEATTAATSKTIEEKEIDKGARMIPRRKTTAVGSLRDSRSSCRGRKDGYYNIGCSSRYFSCLGEKTTMLQCDLGLKFDFVTGECLAKRYVMACGGRPKMPPKYVAPYSGKSATVLSGEAIQKYAAKISKRSLAAINGALNIDH